MFFSRLMQHRYFWLAALLVLTVLVRVVMLLAFPSVFAFDVTQQVHGSEAYDTYARNLLTTGVFGRAAGVPDAAIPPLYSYVLAALYKLFGRGYWQVGLLHITFDTLSIWMLVAISKRIMPRGETVGLLAGLCYALYPYLVFQNLTLIDTPIFMTLLHAFVLSMVLLCKRSQVDRGTWMIAVLGGLSLGLAMLVRPIMPLLAGLIAVWFLFHLNLRQTILRLLPVALIGVLCVGVWTARNYTVFNTFVPMTTTSGGNFWQGNSEYTVPYLKAGYDVQWTSPKDVPTPNLDSRQADAQLFALGLQYLREHPDKIPELWWTKFLVHWSIDVTPRLNPVAGKLPPLDYNGAPIVETSPNGGLQLGGLPPDDPARYSDPVFGLGRIVHRFYFGPLLILALAGFALTLRNWRCVSILWMVQISMTIMYVLFHPSTRYRVPTDPMLFIFSAYALLLLVERLRTLITARIAVGRSTSSLQHRSQGSLRGVHFRVVRLGGSQPTVIERAIQHGSANNEHLLGSVRLPAHTGASQTGFDLIDSTLGCTRTDGQARFSKILILHPTLVRVE